MSTPSECSQPGFSQTACGFVVEFQDIITTHIMNPYTFSIVEGEGNLGGWERSEMRQYINNDIYNTLPSDLRSEIIDTKVVSGHGTQDSSNFITTDKLYLLSTHEVWENVDEYGIEYYDTAYNITRQLDYYKERGVTTENYSAASKTGGNYNNYWWLRSPIYDSAFYEVWDNGATANHASNGYIGVSPAFRVG